MSGSPIEDALSALEKSGEFSLDLTENPFDEVLLAIHVQRFTGRLEIGAGGHQDRLYFREGALMGVQPPTGVDLQGLQEALLQLRLISREILSAVRDEGPLADGRALGERILRHGLVQPTDIDKAAAEQARRRLFQVYDSTEREAVIREGLEKLSHFLPTYVDLRPAIAFGMVVRSSSERRAALRERLAHKHVKVLAPYDEKRNGYGLPPALLFAMRGLADGVTLGADARMAPLSAEESSGLLLLLDRMSLLTIAR